MRKILLAALLAASAATTAAPAAAACSLGQLGTNPWQCGPAVPDEDRGTHYAVACNVNEGVLTAAAVVPYAIEVTIACTVGDVTVEERQEGPAGYVTPWRNVADGPACTRISWRYTDYSEGYAEYGSCS